MSKFCDLPPEVRRQLIDAVGGELLYVPKRDTAAVAERKRQIRRLSELGLNSAEIARRIGVSIRHVQRLR